MTQTADLPAAPASPGYATLVDLSFSAIRKFESESVRQTLHALSSSVGRTALTGFRSDYRTLWVISDRLLTTITDNAVISSYPLSAIDSVHFRHADSGGHGSRHQVLLRLRDSCGTTALRFEVQADGPGGAEVANDFHRALIRRLNNGPGAHLGIGSGPARGYTEER